MKHVGSPNQPSAVTTKLVCEITTGAAPAGPAVRCRRSARSDPGCQLPRSAPDRQLPQSAPYRPVARIAPVRQSNRSVPLDLALPPGPAGLARYCNRQQTARARVSLKLKMFSFDPPATIIEAGSSGICSIVHTPRARAPTSGLYLQPVANTGGGWLPRQTLN